MAARFTDQSPNLTDTTDAHAATVALPRPRSTATGTGHLADVRHVTEWLMATHVPGWAFGWDNATRRAGACHHHTKRLTFSRKIMAGWTMDACRLTILHEIAHALTPGHDHDHVWQRKCIELGGDGKRCWEVTEDRPLPPMPWVGTCPNGHELSRTRAPKPGAKYSCGQCSRRFNSAYLLTWEKRTA